MKPLPFTPGQPAVMTVVAAVRTLGMSHRTYYKRLKDGSLSLEFRMVAGRKMVTVRSVERLLAL